MINNHLYFFIKVQKKILRAFINDFRNNYYYQYFPAKPKVINFNANDICNSRCTMCSIWKQKKDFELSSEHLSSVLENELFSEVEHIGITGGEPTLRKDLPALYEAAIKSLPNLKGVSIITNAIRKNEVIKQIESINALCIGNNKPFTVMVSLDGFEQVHDKVRGKENNFKSAIEVIEYVRKNSEATFLTGCTITKDNIWDVDELLDFMKDNHIYGRFRIAEFINRLYNSEQKDVIRNFNREETYHLACFFKKLELTFEKNDSYRNTYKNISNMLLGKKRNIGCPYKAKGVVLNSKGELLYCAPKSKTIGNAIEESASKIFKSNLQERRRILKENCSDCIHDYHDELTFKELLKHYKTVFWENLLKLKHNEKIKFLKLPLLLFNIRRDKARARKKVFITGWYGTETVGDKAILGHIVDYYKEKYNDPEFFISSIVPFVTDKTIEELDIKAQIVPVYSFEFLKQSSLADEIVMGGGPLMDMEPLAIPFWALKIGKMFKKKTVIFGCGLGPLSKEKYINVVKQLLELADEIKIRDMKSVELAKQLSNRNDVVFSGDPAVHYVRKIGEQIKVTEQKDELALFLREWTEEYKGDLTRDEFLDLRSKFEKNLAEYIKLICNKFNLKPVFYPMHSFVIGSDDRDFNRRFTREYFQGSKYHIYKYNANVKVTIEAMKASKMNLCMRFHSVLFANVLNVNFTAIDYTNGGKIFNFLKDNNSLEKLISFNELANKENIHEYFIS